MSYFFLKHFKTQTTFSHNHFYCLDFASLLSNALNNWPKSLYFDVPYSNSSSTLKSNEKKKIPCLRREEFHYMNCAKKAGYVL